MNRYFFPFLRTFDALELIEVRNHLIGLASNKIEPRILKHGICQELSDVFKDDRYGELVEKLASTWKHRSGSRAYPVPARGFELVSLFSYSEITKARMAYNMSFDQWEGNYGKDRKKLCLYLAKYINNYLQHICLHLKDSVILSKINNSPWEMVHDSDT